MELSLLVNYDMKETCECWKSGYYCNRQQNSWNNTKCQCSIKVILLIKHTNKAKTVVISKY